MKAHEAGLLSRPIEESVARHGASPAAVWMDRHDTLNRGTRRCEAIFRMIGACQTFSILDVGCGPGFAVDFLNDRYGPEAFQYCGVDVSEALLAAASARAPRQTFMHRDIIANPLPELSYDFTAINGVLTARYSLLHREMENFAFSLLELAWRSTRVTLSFNVMSPYVDWTRDDLFHWPVDQALNFCTAKLSRHFNVIADYGLYEYTIQILRYPIEQGRVPEEWSQAQTKAADDRG